MKKFLAFIIILIIPVLSFAQEFGIGKGIGGSIGQATLGILNAANALSGIDTSSGEYSIYGKVLNKKNKPLKGVLITLNGDNTLTTKTNKKGKYLFSSLSSGDYTLTPTLTKYRFKPKTRKITITASDKKKIIFTAIRKSGKISNLYSDYMGFMPDIYPQANEIGNWNYGEPDVNGYYTINGYKMKFYDASDNVIIDIVTGFASVSKVEIEIDSSNSVGSVSGSIFADTTIPITYPLIFNGTLSLEMDSDSFGSLTGTVEVQDCSIDSGATFFSSGAINVTTEGSLTAGGFLVSHSTSGALNVTSSTFQGTLSLTYNVTGTPTPIGNTVDMQLTVNADGTGSYSCSDTYVGNGSF